MKGLKRGMLTLATVTGIAMLTSVQVNAAEINENKENYERLLRPLFDGEWYASNYPDVVKVYGTDDDALFDHFMTFGITEGRDINAVFDVEKYKEANPDLAEQFGDDYAAYYEHYVTYGQAEQRPLQIEGNNSSNDYMLLNEQKSNDSLDDELEVYMEYQRLAREKGVVGCRDEWKRIDDTFYNECNKARELMKSIDIENKGYFNQEEYDAHLKDYKEKIESFENSYNEYKTFAESSVYDLNEVKELVAKASEDNATNEQREDAKKAAENAYNSIVKKREMLNDIINKKKDADNSDKKLSEIKSEYWYSIYPDLEERFEWTQGIEETQIGAKLDFIYQLDILLGLYEDSTYWNVGKINKYMEEVNHESDDYRKIRGSINSFDREHYEWIKGENAALDNRYQDAKQYIEDMFNSYEECGAIIEKYSAEAKEERLTFEALTETKALVKLRDDFSAQLDEKVDEYSKRDEEVKSINAEINQYIKDTRVKWIRQYISEEVDDYISMHRTDLNEKEKECQKILSDDLPEFNMATFLKFKADSLTYTEGGDIDNPETPGEVVNPEDPGTSGEVVNPEDPGTSGEVVNPEDPRTSGEVVNPEDPGTSGEVVNPEDPGTSGEVVNPEDPGTSGEVVNPEDPGISGEVVNPEDPGTSGEVVNPENPGTSGEVVNPEKPGKPSVTISVNGNITITVVDDHTISIDFDGHIETKCAG